MIVRILLLAAALVFPGAAAAGTPGSAVLLGGKVYTLDPKQPWASAVVIRGGRIVYVGSDAGALAHAPREARKIALGGRMVLPGFHDSHIHPMSGGMRLLRCRLGAEDLAVSIAACAQTHSASAWLMGNGWRPGSEPPKRTVLDALVPGRPAYLATEDGYSAWVNSKTLAAAGLDPKTWPASGVVDGAMLDTIRRHIPQPSVAEYREALRRTSAMANRFGITSAVDANANPALLEAYRTADDAGELTLRIVAAQHADPAGGTDQIAAMMALRERTRGKRFRADGAKIFLDGEIDRHTAALLTPYADSPATRGELFLAQDALNAIVCRLDAEGFMIHMHAMGDGAVRAGLDAYAEAIRANGPRDRRHQIAHVGVADPADISRFGALGVAADFQPLWARTDDEVYAPAAQALGPARARWMYPMADIADAGGRLVFGSDGPGPSLNPLDAIQAALAHIPLPAALAAATINGAWVAGEERLDGSLEAGKAADLIVLDRNLFDLAPPEVAKAQVLLTLLDGEAVYRDPSFPWPQPVPHWAQQTFHRRNTHA